MVNHGEKTKKMTDQGYLPLLLLSVSFRTFEGLGDRQE